VVRVMDRVRVKVRVRVNPKTNQSHGIGAKLYQKDLNMQHLGLF
jgi:hypothetical protein